MKTVVTTVVLVLALGLLETSPLPAHQDTTINDKDMSVIDFDDLKYPSFARQAMIQGVVVVQVKLDDNGKVAEVAALSGHELLIPDCLANAKKWRFRPNANRAAIIVYNFRMPNAACKSETLVSFSILQAPNFVTVTACGVPVNPSTSPRN